MTGKMRHAAGGLLAAVMTLSLIFSHGVPVVYADGENITVASVEELEELAKNRTTITIAHRLSTIKRSDEIIVITEDGIAERGTHETLLAKNGIYARYYNL